MEAIEAQGPPDAGWGPSRQRLVAGQDAFAGHVLTGPYRGHDIVVNIAWPVRGHLWRRRLVKDGAPSSVDVLYILRGDDAGPGDDDPDPCFASLEDLQNHLAATRIEWLPPADAVRMIVGQLS